MASTIDFASPSGISRSNSTPDLASLSSYRYGGSEAGQEGAFGRSEKRHDEFSFDNGFNLDTTFRNNGPTRSFPVTQTAEWRPFESKVELEQLPPPAPRRSRTGSLIDSTRLRFPGSKSSKELPQSRPETPNEDAISNAKLGSSGRTKSKTDSFTSFAKRSWLSSSSSSSSSNTPAKDSSSKPVGSRRAELTADPQLTANRWSEPTKSAPRPFTRATSYFSKMKQKQPIIEKPMESDRGSQSSATSDGPPSASTPGVFSPQSTPYDSNGTPTTENSFSELTTVQAQDPLWPTFKSMEMEFKVFISKSTSQQVVMVKTTVLPFLRNTANHWSTKKLHPDDLDRRSQVLNTWWTEILDMLDGTSVPGVDRPVLYEALTSIMMRSEWRLTTPHFLSSADRDLRETLRSNTWGKGLPPSSNPDKPTTLVEAAERNVRATFVTSLVKQVVFVVEKMSLRYAPMPLVTFAGKTCAYAFFFIPGFAEVLARQWGVSQHQLKRTAEDLGIPSLAKTRRDEVPSLFPPHLLSLCWTTPKTMFNMLRQESQTPVSMPGLSWSGHWKPRWKGLDTDLFFVFCKYFHVLSNDFLPASSTLEEKAQSPAFVLIQAQLLLNIDKTLHRQSAEAAANALPPLPKGSSLLSLAPGSDATAMDMSLPASEMGDYAKGMSDSKVIVLLRGVLFDASPEQEGARRTFAEAFTRLVAGAVRKTSLYDSHACFTLCDFLEESLIIYDEFASPGGLSEYVDWAFWLDVLKKMLLSLNTVTEVRVLCFIFAIWDIIAKDPKRKTALCNDWLLTEEIFDAFYNHWCPLVRGYYHRLLCWRICRCDGNATAEDLSIFKLAAARLETTWAHYLYMKQIAEQNGRFPPSTAAMVPTPGKKFMIIRQEADLPRIGSFRNLDSALGPAGAGMGYADEVATATATPNQNANSKKKKSLLGKVIAFSAGVGNTPVPVPDDGLTSKPPSRNPSWDDEFINARRETAESRTRSPSVGSDLSAGLGHGADSACPPTSPREPANPFRFILAFSEPSGPPQERLLSLPRLPTPAQGVARPRDQGPTLLRAATSMAAPSRPPPPPPPKDTLVRAESQEQYRMMTSSTWPLKTDATDLDMARARQDSVASGIESPASSFERVREPAMEASVQPRKPTGIFARNAVYSGRSMAEWAQVVVECNNFSERRRQEGVMTLKGIEVPMLSVDGFQGMSG